MDELEREHKQRVSLDLVNRTTRVANRLRHLDETSRILVTSNELDEPLAGLERYVQQAVLALDRKIQHEITLLEVRNRQLPHRGTEDGRPGVRLELRAAGLAS